MQLLLSSFTLLLSLRCVSAANEIRVIFNNGLPPSQHSSCSESEYAKIDAVFTHRRYLRSNDIHPSPTSETSLPSSVGTRSVQTNLRKCADICKGYVPRTCKKIGCVGYRELSSGDRNLASSCPDEINAMHAKLDALQKNVTVSCKSFLQFDGRRADCYADYEYGQIEGLRVWKRNSTGQYIYRNFIEPDRHSHICNGVKYSFESLNQPCVDTATLRLTGPSNYTHEKVETSAPYTLFGNMGSALNSRAFNQTGIYNLTITPDHDVTKTKKFSFKVWNCTQ